MKNLDWLKNHFKKPEWFNTVDWNELIATLFLMTLSLVLYTFVLTPIFIIVMAYRCLRAIIVNAKDPEGLIKLMKKPL